MARSTYVYVVTDEAGVVAAVFTVKHELERWLGLFAHKKGLRVVRHRDGHPSVDPVELNRRTLEPA